MFNGLVALVHRFAPAALAPLRRSLFDSLSANAFGIYLIYYPAVLWTLFALLGVAWPAWLKFGVTFSAGLALSGGGKPAALADPGPPSGRQDKTAGHFLTGMSRCARMDLNHHSLNGH